MRALQSGEQSERLDSIVYCTGGCACNPCCPCAVSAQYFCPATSLYRTCALRRKRACPVLAGYRYGYPYLKPADLVCTDDSHVAPLYKHVFAVKAAPTLAFIGLPWKCLRNVQYELQVSCQRALHYRLPRFEERALYARLRGQGFRETAVHTNLGTACMYLRSSPAIDEMKSHLTAQAAWVARVLSGRATLPDKPAMMKHVQRLESLFEEQNVPLRYLHNLSDAMPENQWSINDFLAAECCHEVPAVSPWRRRVAALISRSIFQRPDTLRDEDDPETAKLLAVGRKELLHVVSYSSPGQWSYVPSNAEA